MNILKDLLSEVTQQALELSQRLYDEAQALRNESAVSVYHSKIQKLNEMIWRYHESNRRALVVEDKHEASQTGKLLYQAKTEKSQLMLQHTQHQENLRRELESLTKPVIGMSCDRIDDEIKALPKRMVGGVVATEAYYRFTRIGENCLVSEDPDLQLIQAAHMKKGDVMVAISHTGRSRTILDAVKEARKHEATVVLITNFPVSPLAKHANIILRTAEFSKQFTDEVISKRVTELCIIESLYINYLIKKGLPTLERLKRSNDSVKVNKLGRPVSSDAIG